MIRPAALLLPSFALLSAGCVAAEIEPPEPLYGEEPIAYPEELWDEGVEGSPPSASASPTPARWTR
jgi:hypothetical protein